MSSFPSLFFSFFQIYRRDRKFEEGREIFRDFYFDGWTTNWLDDFSILFDSMDLRRKRWKVVDEIAKSNFDL